MSLGEHARAELERRGVNNIRSLIASMSPVGPSVIVPIGLNENNPAARDVEDWLREKDLEADRLAAERHREQVSAARQGVRWAKLAFWAVIVTIIIGVLQIWPKKITGIA